MLIELVTKRYPGMRFWLLQRVTALYMAIYVPLLVLYFCLVKPVGYEAWLAFNAPWWWRIASCLFFFSLCLHAWIGIRDVFRDYVPSQTVRDYLQILIEIALLACLVWSIFIFWSI